MKHDVRNVLIKHINDLYQILEMYKVSDRLSFVSVANMDLVFQKAILMSVGYIGELSKKLDDSIKQSNLEVNWRRLGTSRNIIFHNYDIVDMEIISSVVFRDISTLKLIKEVDNNDIRQTLDLVDNVFSDFVAPDYSEQGKTIFKNYLNNIYEKFSSGCDNIKIWACYQSGKIIGVIATRDISHISLMFVDSNHHKKGVAKYLFNTMLDEIKTIKDVEIKQITVNSSPYAVKAYECLGFIKSSEQQEKDGIIFTPMIYKL